MNWPDPRWRPSYDKYPLKNKLVEGGDRSTGHDGTENASHT